SAALASGQWGNARLALDRQAELTRDRDWAATLQGLGAHIAEFHEGNDDAAAGRYRRLLEVRAADPVALAALERIASRTGDAAAQVTLAESAVDRSGDPAERAALAMRAAELAETAGHDLPRAAALARRALEAAEASLRLGTEIPAFDKATRFAWCFRAGTIFEERAAADDEAVRAYEAALALAPGSRAVLAGLARAHHRRGRFEALAGVL